MLVIKSISSLYTLRTFTIPPNIKWVFGTFSRRYSPNLSHLGLCSITQYHIYLLFIEYVFSFLSYCYIFDSICKFYLLYNKILLISLIGILSLDYIHLIFNTRNEVNFISMFNLWRQILRPAENNKRQLIGYNARQAGRISYIRLHLCIATQLFSVIGRQLENFA